MTGAQIKALEWAVDVADAALIMGLQDVADEKRIRRAQLAVAALRREYRQSRNNGRALRLLQRAAATRLP